MKTLARIVVAVPVFLVTSNVRFVASDTWFHQNGFRTYNVDQTTGISLDELDAADEDLVRYFEDDRSTLRIQVDVDGQETQLFGEEETLHMRDVKTLMRAVYRLNEASLAIILAYVGGVVLWARERNARDLARYSLFGVGVGVLLVGFVGVFAVTGFDEAWTTFHEIAFRNDAWQLDPDTDRLIQMFPEPFWEDMTFLVGGLTLAEVLLVVSAASSYLVFARPRSGGGANGRNAEGQRRSES
jgi:integral membrane protein (TIGR01906 family)